MLEIKNLHVKLEAEDKAILKGVDLTVGAGTVHAIMGPNGSGKSTLSYVLAGREGYLVTEGSATLEGAELLEMAPEERAAAGLFLAFQYPVEIPGVGNMTFLRTAVNAQRKARGEAEMSSGEFLKVVRAKAASLKIDAEMMKRPVNVGFSGGEKKRNEILQMAMLEPRMCILDETDSGLDVDAMKLVAEGVNALRDAGRAFLVITHYQRLLDHIRPDVVHIMADGRIVQSGGPDLALEVEANGYAGLVPGGGVMRAVAEADGLAARIAGLGFERAGWAGPAREAALARLTAMSLPRRRDEYWRYTDPVALNAAGVDAGVRGELVAEAPVFDGTDRLQLVFVDGVFDAAQSDPLDLAGVEIARLADVAARDIHWAREVYGVHEGRGQSPVARPFAALNTAFATDGVLIRVTGRAARPVALVYHSTSNTSDAILHHCVKIEAGAELTLLESGPGAARFNTVTEVDVGAGGRFHHVRVQGRAHDRRAVTHLFVRLAEGALAKSFTLTANGRLTRNEAVIDLAGAGGTAHLAGAAVGDGRFHHDDTVFVTHAAEGCESRQVFKKVLKNGAVGVFQGKILVQSQAQKTDGYQISQSLLLDEDSQFLAKPELEIYADDVKCSHGSTSGAIDATALFYLRSRGLPETAARTLLVLAFLAEALDEVADASLVEDIRGRLEGWLNRHGGA